MFALDLSFKRAVRIFLVLNVIMIDQEYFVELCNANYIMYGRQD